MSKPISAFDEWVGATGQNPLAKEYDASGTLKILNSDALIGNTVPLFYLNIGDKPVPIFTKGKNSYKNLVDSIFVEYNEEEDKEDGGEYCTDQNSYDDQDNDRYYE